MNYIKPVFKFFRRPLKKLKLFLKQRAGWLDIPKIIVFRGFGNRKEFFIQGRVIEDSGLAKPADRQKIWHNLLATIKRFASDEIAGVRVKGTFNEQVKLEETDEYGFFSFVFKTPPELGQWLVAEFELVDDIVEDQPVIKESGEVIIISEKQKRVIISDIDDTVLISHSTQILRKLRLMLLKNAQSRLPVNDVAAFYRALEKGGAGKVNNPFFYVSSSEWNLYDLLDDFCNYHDIPKGVFLLRTLNHSIYKFWKSGVGNHEHKYDKIKHLIDFFPDQKFILIGDSGQHDPLIYRRIALEYPLRIEAIYIRKVRSRGTKVLEEMHGQFGEENTVFKELRDYNGAIEHARECGFIA